MKWFNVKLKIKSIVSFPVHCENDEAEEAARCRAIGLGYDPDDIVSIIEETPVRGEGETL